MYIGLGFIFDWLFNNRVSIRAETNALYLKKKNLNLLDLRMNP